MNPGQRLQSIDALRGFDMLLIMGLTPLIASLCGLCPSTLSDTIAQNMKHPEWDGLTLYDTIFPLFLFIAGISFPFSLDKQRASGIGTGRIQLRILRRVVLLIVLGLIYNGFFGLNLSTLRIPSVLGRIGLAWGIAALLTVHFGTRTRIAITTAILIAYGLFSALVASPDAAGAGPLTPEGCFAGYVDSHLLSGHLYWDDFDPEGLFTTLPAVATALLGILTGEFIRRTDLTQHRKVIFIGVAAALLIALGMAFDGVLPINKSLWSSTFVCVVGGYSLAMFGLFYYLIDIRGWQRWTLFLRVVGLNSITIYMAQRIVDFRRISNLFTGGFAEQLPEQWGAVVLAAAYLAVNWLFLYFLYRKQVFLKI